MMIHVHVYIYLQLQAVQSFSKAILLIPGEQELWKEDLEWANSLLVKKKLLEAAALEAAKAQSQGKIVELDSDRECTTVNTYHGKPVSQDTENQDSSSTEYIKEGMGIMPRNYIKMKDVT